MKKKLVIMALAVLCLGSANAQTVYDAVDFATKDLNGTARYVSMGGAMSALGGDISTIGINPAGIGIYRSNDIVTSFGYSVLTSDVDNLGTVYSSSKDGCGFDNIGFVFSSKIGNKTMLRNVNFAVSYHKANSFNRNMVMAGDLNGHSQLFQIAGMSDGLTPKQWNNGSIFDNNSIGWLSALAWEGYLISPSITTNKTESIITASINGESELILSLNTPYNEPKNPVIVLEDSIDVTSKATITSKIEGPSNKIDTSIEGTYTITYNISYNGFTDKLVKTIQIKNS